MSSTKDSTAAAAAADVTEAAASPAPAESDEPHYQPEVLALGSHQSLLRYQHAVPADDEAEADEDAVYTGPPIGSPAKTQWPELLGADVDAAVAVIEVERSDMLLVQPTRKGAIVSKDMAARRVRVWFDPETRKVVEIPKIGMMAGMLHTLKATHVVPLLQTRYVTFDPQPADAPSNLLSSISNMLQLIPEVVQRYDDIRMPK